MNSQCQPADLNEKCMYYGSFLSHLDSCQVKGVFWTMFGLILCILFSSSWVFQKTMLYRKAPESTFGRPFGEATFRHRLKIAICVCTSLQLLASALLTVEVYSLLSLQFCVSEDLITLYWSTWTVLQMGAVIAMLGIVLALVHAICQLQDPLWSLALGTPVLVVAGIGHLLGVLLERSCQKTLGGRRQSSQTMQSRDQLVMRRPATFDKISASSASSIRPEHLHSPLASNDVPMARQPRTILLEIDTGENADLTTWPGFVGFAPDGTPRIRVKMQRPHGVEG